MGLWVAEQIGLSGAEAEAYAKDVVAADLEEAGDDDVVRKIMADLQVYKIDLSEHRVRVQLTELHDVARQQIAASSKPIISSSLQRLRGGGEYSGQTCESLPQYPTTARPGRTRCTRCRGTAPTGPGG